MVLVASDVVDDVADADDVVDEGTAAFGLFVVGGALMVALLKINQLF